MCQMQHEIKKTNRNVFKLFNNGIIKECGKCHKKLNIIDNFYMTNERPRAICRACIKEHWGNNGEDIKIKQMEFTIN